MASEKFGGAASSLLSELLDGVPVELVEVARTALSVHYSTGASSLPVISVASPSATRLPNALVTETLPGPGRAALGAGLLVAPAGTWAVTRWWLPPRPRGLRPPLLDAGWLLPGQSLPGSWGLAPVSPSYDGLQPASLIGAGPGLSPAGDDLVAGALVAAHATADPRLVRWQRTVRDLLAPGRTTAVSLGLLHCALDGYATSELAGFVNAVCDQGPGTDPTNLTRATEALLGVGHSSGAALMAGVLHTFTTIRMRGAA